MRSVAFLTLVLALQIALIARSTPRRVGDSAEYVAMEVNLARAQPPSLTASELAHAATLFPGEGGFAFVMPAFRGPDGRGASRHECLDARRPRGRRVAG